MPEIVNNGTGICPHCGVGVQFIPVERSLPSGWFKDPEFKRRSMQILTVMCAICSRPIVVLQTYIETIPIVGGPTQIYEHSRFIWPPVVSRKPLPKDVPAHISEDYREAALVLPSSEKASAALSRRCLQSLLREAGHTKSKDLADQIEEILPTLPGYLQPQPDAVRNIGNFAAHPQKSKASGEIIDVEPGEAEWNLDVLDLLFDFYYERPKIAQQKRDALNKKLMDAGKPTMK